MQGILTGWVRWVSTHARLTLLLLVVATLGLAWVAVDRFHLNANLSDLIQQDAPWRTDFDTFEAKFPDLVRTGVVVVKSRSLDQVERSTSRIVSALQDHPDTFRAVAAPGSEAFFRNHALLYMGLEALDNLADRLAEAQPWLTAVAQDPSLRGILGLVGEGVGAEADLPAGFADVVSLLAGSARRHLNDQDAHIAWTDKIFAQDDVRYQLIYFKAQTVAGQPLPDARVVGKLREIIGLLQLPRGVDVSLTGEIPLQHEEIEAAVSGVTLAGWLSLVLLFVVMLAGVRSGKIIAGTFIMLAIGIIWTSAYAMLAVGEFNTLSVVFVVMFFGLGVDFALHFSLRYQEAVNHGDVTTSLLDSTQSVGRAISLCTLTTAIGFLGFWPTAYAGLADLGVICAGGMVVAWLLTFTFLPAFYTVVGAPRVHQMDLPTSNRIVQALLLRRNYVVGLVAVGGLLAAGLAAQAKFDYSVLALKDSNSESMRALRELQAQGLSTDYQLFVVSDKPVDVARVEQLDVVAEVRTPNRLVPTEQEEKLAVVQDLQGLLYSALEPQRRSPVPDAVQIRLSIQELIEIIDTALAEEAGPLGKPLAQLQEDLAILIQADDTALMSWQEAVVDGLVDELEWLNTALWVDPVTFDQLPQSTRQRLTSTTGEQLTLILPREDIADVSALSAFITGVRGVVANATGRPVIEWGVGQIVVEAFRQALLFAVVGICLVLVVALGRLKTVAMVLLPLLLTALCAFAVGVALNQPVNMASILVLPLIFGLGVDNGIHVVDRYLHESSGGQGVERLMHSSTPRAVLLSTLTTIGAFSALSLSPHAGTASIGFLLTVSVGFLLLFTVFLLPVLLGGRGKSVSQ